MKQSYFSPFTEEVQLSADVWMDSWLLSPTGSHGETLSPAPAPPAPASPAPKLD